MQIHLFIVVYLHIYATGIPLHFICLMLPAECLQYVNLVILAVTYHILKWQFVAPSVVWQVRCNYYPCFLSLLVIAPRSQEVEKGYEKNKQSRANVFNK